ncbi:MAG: hypothetical protein LQ351_002237 [Letrouitia transgressa]|nr:MAG: hypothetical protein LQ351_002237 [Letrouitia transgressa]
MPNQDDYSTLALHLPSLARPTLASNHSSSLPSTPYQRTRKFEFQSRSPSPSNLPGNSSPRSTHSESETGLRTHGQGGSLTSGCKYEKGMAYSRRRIPYSEGGDQLERPSTMPKKYLNPTEEDKLSGDMRELYDRILPTRDSDERRAKFVWKLQNILNKQWPGNDIKVHVFGSSGNMLCTTDSDVDICITTPMKALERVCHLAAALADHGMQRVVCVNHAKVPIVKVWDPELQLACDMNVNNTLALENTRMIKTYVEIDERVRPLAMIVKYWTKKRILNDAALGGTLSSYTWICMILNFLQTRNPPVLPCLQKRPHQRLLGLDGTPSAFADDIESLRGFGRKNKETLGELLFHFFRRYAYEIDYEKNVISVREGQLISKEGKRWHLMQNNRLCVEEPFNTGRNLGNTADDISFRGLHLEIRRAFGLISEADLAECTEQYIFPAVEEKIWEKPIPKQPPSLTRSQSQSGRGGRGGLNNRGGRNGQSQFRNIQGRRASSAATSHKYNVPQFSLRNQAGHETPIPSSFDHLQLHERILNEYQLLQAREQELRLLQMQAQLQAQAQAQAQAQNPTPMPSFPPQATGDSSNRLSGSSQAPLTAPLRTMPFFQPFVYPPVHNGQNQGIQTNPSSPSMKSAQLVSSELRPRAHRSSAADANSSTSRSHSQPARPVQMALPVSAAPPMPMNAAAVHQYQQYHQMRQQQLYNALEISQRQRHVENYNPRPIVSEQAYEDNLPKEYVGYYVHDSPPSRPYRDVQVIPQMPAYNDLFYRHRYVRPEINRQRNLPRSPSPPNTGSFRDRSQSVRSATSAPPGPVPMERSQNSTSSRRYNGPIIVNGSDRWETGENTLVADNSSRTTTASEATSASEDQLYETSATATANSSRGLGSYDIASSEAPQRTPQHFPIPEIPRPSDILRSSRLEPIVRPPDIQQINGRIYESVPINPNNYPKPPTNGLGIRYEDGVANEVSKDLKHKVQPLQPDTTQTDHAQQVDPKPDAASPRIEKPSNPLPLPLLSPVREVRSPSPATTARKKPPNNDAKPAMRFISPLKLDIPPFSPERHAQRKQKDALARQLNGNDIPNVNQAAAITKPTIQYQINGWQQPTKKNKRKSKGPLSQIPTEMTTGEPLPPNEADRKGG